MSNKNRFWVVYKWVERKKERKNAIGNEKKKEWKIMQKVNKSEQNAKRKQENKK